MTLNQLRDWMNNIPDEYGEFQVVFGEEHDLDDEYEARMDIPLNHAYVDTDTSEVVLLEKRDL